MNPYEYIKAYLCLSVPDIIDTNHEFEYQMLVTDNRGIPRMELSVEMLSFPMWALACTG